MLDRGSIKVCDFGFIKCTTTKTYTILGTREYQAPEMLKKKGYSYSVDWWSYGILLYEMIFGFVPFSSENKMELFKMIIEGKFKFPTHKNDVDELTKNIISSFLQTDPQLRLGCDNLGVESIKRHKWFSSVDWIELITRRKNLYPY